MAQLPKTLKDFTVFIDGYGYGGRVTEGTPPPVSLVTAEHSAGGMAGTIDISMGEVEKLEFEVTLAEAPPAVIGLIGQDDIGVTFRGAQGDGSGVDSIIIETRGLMKKNDRGSWKKKEPGEFKVTMSPTYYCETVAGEVLVEIDVINGIFRAGGVDHREGIRAALGE